MGKQKDKTVKVDLKTHSRLQRLEKLEKRSYKSLLFLAVEEYSKKYDKKESAA